MAADAVDREGRHDLAVATYGSLGAVFGFMTWLWITAIIVIVGAEHNGEIERQTAGTAK